MIKLICFFIFLFPAIVIGQNLNTIIEDFNNDGYIDTLKSDYYGGGSFGGTDVTLINGKTKENFELDSWGCFCDIKRIILIPPELREASNKCFLEVMKKELLPEKKNMPDASLQWVITANANGVELSDNIYYNLFIKSPPQWVLGEIELPDTYYIDVKGDTLHNLYFTDTEIPEWYNSESNEGWLVYYGSSLYRNRNGDSLVLADASPTYKVFRTSHGVAVEKDNSYVWVFVSDYRLIDVPGKLRWESIGKIELVNKYIIVQLIDMGSSNPIFIIDIEKGISGRLRGDGIPYSYTIDKDKIIIENNFSTKSYELEKLFNELSK